VEVPVSAAVRFSIRRPWLVIGLWLTLAVAAAPLALGLAGAVTAGGVSNPRGEGALAQHTLEQAFHEAPSSLLVVLHNGTGVESIVDEVRRVAGGLPHAVSVTDYRTNPGWLAADGHTTVVRLGFDTDSATTQDLVGEVRDRMAAARLGAEVHVTGAPALDFDLTEQMQKDTATAEAIAFPLLLIVLLLVFRSVAAMLVPLAVAGLALVITRALGTLFAHATEISIMFLSAASIIGLAVAVDYSLFVIKRYRDELAAGADYPEALATAMRTAGRAVLFSGLAVVVALLALFIPRMVFFTSIGLAGILVTLVALAMSMTLLPAVLTLLGRRIHWGSLRPRRIRPSTVARRIRRPLPLLLILVALFVALAWPIGTIRMQITVASSSILPATADSRQGAELLDHTLDARGLFPVQLVLTSPNPAQLSQGAHAATELATAQPHTAAVLPALAAPGVTLITVIPKADPDSPATHDLVYALRDKLPGVLAPGVTPAVTGVTAQGVDFDDEVLRSLPAILAAVALITLLLLTRAFRSLRLPLLALALNAMVVAASLGLLTLISQHLLNQSINSATPILLFAVMFGLSMDYLVIMISRMREHYLAGADHPTAVHTGLADTRGLVNGAALIMVAVFASFLTAKISIVAQLGLGLAIAVTLDALVIRLLVMPAALLLTGPRAWGRRAIPKVVDDTPVDFGRLPEGQNALT
jgi:putative drug exporter of the RND superfamily